jgi:Flp pilus assembly protein TadD
MKKQIEGLSLPSIAMGVLIVLFISGCAPVHKTKVKKSGAEKNTEMVDSLNYVRFHKGEGSRVLMLGSEPELMDAAAKYMTSLNYEVTREQRAVFARQAVPGYPDKNSSYAFYFYPAPTQGHTDVEILYAFYLSNQEHTLDAQASTFFYAFPVKFINTKALKEGTSPTLTLGAGLALTGRARKGDREEALKLVVMGADIDMAIARLEKVKAICAPYLDKANFRQSYDECDQGIKMLNGLRGEAENSKKADKRREVEKENEAAFQAALRSYQTAKVKPELSEKSRRFKVQAEGAIRDKDFVGAVDLYGEALKVSPWWPEGHFNRALVLAETKDYDTAIIEMKRYLALVPNAPNARAAQDKIYDWERKAQK